MKISNNFNKVSFGNVYGVYGSKQELEKFDENVRKKLQKDSYVDTFDMTKRYANNDGLITGILTQEAKNGKEIAIYVTGKEDCDKIKYMEWSEGRITQHIKRAVDASKTLPRGFMNEFVKSAKSTKNKK